MLRYFSLRFIKIRNFAEGWPHQFTFMHQNHQHQQGLIFTHALEPYTKPCWLWLTRGRLISASRQLQCTQHQVRYTINKYYHRLH